MIKKLEELRDYITELYDDNLIEYYVYYNLIDKVDNIALEAEKYEK